jgi:DedD protein
MADKDETTGSGHSDDGAAELRGTLTRRLAVAGVLVAILLGVLAFFDHLASPDEPGAPVFTEPVPVAPKKDVSQPVTPTENPPEARPGDGAPATVSETPPPPVLEATPTTGNVGGGKTGASPESGHGDRHPARTPITVAPAHSTPAARPAPIVEETAPPQPLGQTTPTTSTPPPATAATARPPPRLISGFILQAGVFTSPQLAEELHAKLTLSGVPSSVETRVQVGPFSTRQEAEAAQARLKEQGIQTLLVPPTGRR